MPEALSPLWGERAAKKKAETSEKAKDIQKTCIRSCAWSGHRCVQEEAIGNCNACTQGRADIQGNDERGAESYDRDHAEIGDPCPNANMEADPTKPKPTAVLYKQGVIYTPVKTKRFRALLVRGDNYKERSQAWGDDKKAAWERAWQPSINIRERRRGFTAVRGGVSDIVVQL